MHVRICKSGVFERLCLPPIAAATVCALSDHLTPPPPMAQAEHITPATPSDGATSFSRSSTVAETVPIGRRPPFARTLPDAPRVKLDEPCRVLAYCLDDLDTPRLNRMGEKLWWAGPSPEIVSLTQHAVLDRRIQVTEDPAVHCLWAEGIVYLKPLPLYLTSYAFWEYLYEIPSDQNDMEERERLRTTALGFVRTYARLIQRRSDFTLARRSDLLPPGDIAFEAFAAFVSAFDSVPDADVSSRWRFGLIQLDALNFHSSIHLRRWHLNRYESRYTAYFQRFFPVVLFIFALFSVALSAMQVILGARQLWDTDNKGLKRTLGLFVWFAVESIGWSFAFGLLFMVCAKQLYWSWLLSLLLNFTLGLSQAQPNRNQQCKTGGRSINLWIDSSILVYPHHRLSCTPLQIESLIPTVIVRVHPSYDLNISSAFPLAMMPQNDPDTTPTLDEPDVNNIRANASAKDPFKYSHGFTGVDQPANYLFANILLATILALVILTLSYRTFVRIRNDRRRVSIIRSHLGQNFWRTDRYLISGLLKKHFLYAPLYGNRHSRESRASSTIASNAAYCLMLTGQLPVQRAAGLRGRCGALATFNLIFTVLFALRNNPFIWILGISYDTFNLFHRWTARLVMLESTVHVAAFIYNTYHVHYKGKGGWSSVEWILDHSTSYWWGLIGFAAFIFLLIQSIGTLRRAFYDAFLTLHRLGIIVAVSGVYFHLARHALPQVSWVYIFMTLLALEPVARIGRIMYYNFSWRQRIWTRITVEALPGDATRIYLSIPRSWNCRPGLYAYVYLPRLAPFSSHPFSIAWHTCSGYTRLDTQKIDENAEGLAIKSGPSTISFIVRARGGMTRSLYKRALKAKNRYIELWGAIEGPYGGHHSLSSYGTVVLFAAGAGITHQLSFVPHLLAGYNHNTSATRKVLLVWCIPHIECLEWICPWLEELAAIENCADIVSLRLYISRSAPQEATNLSQHLQIEVYSRRCNPQEIVDEQILAQVGAMVVTVCGPGGFNDSVRAAVRRRVELRSIDFFEETFSG
ncbi:hypothetical protein OPT61_g8083 [Boeremia exigua]|uniref:Uncharacterized protein n=1 Tax=Boeremia exigua TaxID=749465 RepID=A0ACC2I024_9PLEO|nr:hypothetical protein OPT61_g8083 [Boeremia exigua]